MDKILIIGGAGFLGFHLSKYLLKKRFRIDLLDDFSRGVKDVHLNKLINSKNINLISCDLTKSIPKKLSKNYKYIYQFAAILGVQNVINNPSDVLTKNIQIQINSIKIAKKQNKLKKFIFSSTSEVHIGSQKKLKMKFPTPENFPIVIDDLNHPRTSYSLSKIYCEAMCIHSNLNYIIIRPHNLYGERMGDAHVIPQLLKRISQYKTSETLKIKSGTHKRCFCYIEDAVKQIYKLTISPKALMKIFNIGNNSEEIKISSLLSILIKICKKTSLKILYINENDGSPKRRVPDLSHTKKLTNVKKFTKLSIGVKKVHNWYKSNNLLNDE